MKRWLAERRVGYLRHNKRVGIASSHLGLDSTLVCEVTYSPNRVE